MIHRKYEFQMELETRSLRKTLNRPIKECKINKILHHLVFCILCSFFVPTKFQKYLKILFSNVFTLTTSHCKRKRTKAAQLHFSQLSARKGNDTNFAAAPVKNREQVGE